MAEAELAEADEDEDEWQRQLRAQEQRDVDCPCGVGYDDGRGACPAPCRTALPPPSWPACHGGSSQQADPRRPPKALLPRPAQHRDGSPASRRPRRAELTACADAPPACLPARLQTWWSAKGAGCGRTQRAWHATAGKASRHACNWLQHMHPHFGLPPFWAWRVCCAGVASDGPPRPASPGAPPPATCPRLRRLRPSLGRHLCSNCQAGFGSPLAANTPTAAAAAAAAGALSPRGVAVALAARRQAFRTGGLRRGPGFTLLCLSVQ